MSDELNGKLDRILEDTTRIKTALWPDEGQEGVLTKHDKRLDELEDWQGHIKGGFAVLGTLWAALTAAFGIHIGGKH